MSYYYNKISKGYNELHGEEQLNKLSVIRSNIRINKDSRILDVGCGTGISSGFDCFVVGVDTSFRLLRQNKRLKVNSAAESLPFKDKKFDFVISVTSMHNFTDIGKAMDEIKRVGRQKFVFSILRKAGKFDDIIRLIEKKFKIAKIIEEDRDMILFCETLT